MSGYENTWIRMNRRFHFSKDGDTPICGLKNFLAWDHFKKEDVDINEKLVCSRCRKILQGE